MSKFFKASYFTLAFILCTNSVSALAAEDFNSLNQAQFQLEMLELIDQDGQGHFDLEILKRELFAMMDDEEKKEDKEENTVESDETCEDDAHSDATCEQASSSKNHEEECQEICEEECKKICEETTPAPVQLSGDLQRHVINNIQSLINTNSLIPTNYKTKLCLLWLNTGCCYLGNKCTFAHHKNELNPHPSRNTVNCKYLHTYGNCYNGAKCRFRH